MSRRGRPWGVWLPLYVGICFLYVYFIPYFPALNNPNENSRVYQIRSLVELHKLSINEQIARYGMVNDLGKREGKYYAGKAPGTTFWGASIYAALYAFDTARGQPSVTPFRLIVVIRLLGTIAPTLVFVLLFRMFLLRLALETPIANALSVVLALGTMMLPYALIYVNHSLSAATAFGAFMAVETAKQTQTPLFSRQRFKLPMWMGIAGFFIAASAALDYALLPVSCMLLFYAAFRLRFHLRCLWPLALGALVPATLTALYHTICWGGPFRFVTSYLANPQYAKLHASGFAFGIDEPSLMALRGILVRPDKGLLYFSPIFALGFMALVVACLRKSLRLHAGLALAITLWMILYNSSLLNWDGGWTVGPRYITVIVPFVILGLALAWKSLEKRHRRLVLPFAIGLGIVSILVMTLTSVLFPHLPPDYKNPVHELIWPLWRDGFTPTSLGGLVGWHGHAVQIPFLIVLGLVLAYLVKVAQGRFLLPRSSNKVLVASTLLLPLVVTASLWFGSIPKTESKALLTHATAWVRHAVWNPRHLDH